MSLRWPPQCSPTSACSVTPAVGDRRSNRWSFIDTTSSEPSGSQPSPDGWPSTVSTSSARPPRPRSARGAGRSPRPTSARRASAVPRRTSRRRAASAAIARTRPHLSSNPGVAGWASRVRDGHVDGFDLSSRARGRPSVARYRAASMARRGCAGRGRRRSSRGSSAPRATRRGRAARPGQRSWRECRRGRALRSARRPRRRCRPGSGSGCSGSRFDSPGSARRSAASSRRRGSRPRAARCRSRGSRRPPGGRGLGRVMSCSVARTLRASPNSPAVSDARALLGSARGRPAGG